jgi:hypothetical protein
VEAPGSTKEHKAIRNLRAAIGDKGLFRQWHQKFTTALGQVKTECDKIVHKFARDIAFGRKVETILSTFGRGYGPTFGETFRDIWKVLIDRAKAGAKTIPRGHGIKAYGVVYRWFTDSLNKQRD